MILGTAGHIDHGKTALVRALTGVDTDRLAEEKRRGITIELGFAPLVLDDGAVVSVVDVPGHERFVDTMTAGAWPLDAAVLVVAATEGVMPQTREHCAILRAFGVPVLTTALTNVDRVAHDDLASIDASVRAALMECAVDPTTPIVHTVAPRGDGIEALRAAIADARATIPPRDSDDLTRFVVDRAFTLRGIGTVVTGTLCTGRLAVGDRVRILPDASESRIRGIHTHGAPLTSASAGGRFALALADLAPAHVPRGATLVTDDAWRATTRLLARLDVRAERPARGGVLHVAGASSPARVSIVDAGCGLVRLSLARALVARAGDRIVLRSGEGALGVTAGAIIDPLPDRRVGVVSTRAAPAARLEMLAAAAGVRGVARTVLPIRLGLAPRATAAVVRRAGVLTVGQRVVARALLAEIEERVVGRVSAWNAEHPFAPGVSVGELGTLLHVDPALVDGAVAAAVANGRLAVDRGIVSRATSELSAGSAALLARVVHAVSAAGLEPPTVAELVETFGADAESVVRHAERAGNLVRVGGVRCYAAPVLAQGIERLRVSMRGGGEYSPSELRAVLGVSRKYLIPLLEYCDSIGVTERRSGGRVLVDVSSR